MKKLLSIALLLFSIAAPSATYSDEAPRNPGKTSASVETQKADNIKPATLKRRCCAYFLLGSNFFTISTMLLILISPWLIPIALDIGSNIIFGSMMGGSQKPPLEAFLDIIPQKLPLLAKNKTLFSIIAIFAVIVANYLLLKLSRWILKIKVVDISGKDATWKQLLIRYLIINPPLLLLVLFSWKIWLMVSSLWTVAVIASTLILKDRRGFPDKIAKTIVVDK